MDDELSEELRFHLEHQIGVNIASGMKPSDARSAALKDLGGIEQVTEECRDMRRTQWLETLVQDICFGVRIFRRQPGFTVCVLALLALGIGSTTAIFSIVNGALLTPLPYREPENLVRIFGTWEQGSREGISPPDFLDYRQRSASFESLAAASNSTPLLNLKAVGDPEQVRSRTVTAGFFSTLGIQPMIGREFRREDETWKGPAVAILSYGLWQRQFGSDPSIVGGPLRINGVAYTVVGVLPPFFNFLGSTDLFTPAQFNPVPGMRSARVLIAIGRLKAGVDLQQARAELDLIGNRLQQEHAQFDRGWSATAAPLTSEVVKDARPGLLLLLYAIGLVLLLVSASIASLMLSHAARRQGEVAVRIALGASRGRVMRQLLTENLLLAMTGGMAGCAVAYWGVELIKRFGPASFPRLSTIGIDLRVLAFAFAASALTGLAFGLGPAVRAGRADVAEQLKTKARSIAGSIGVRDALVVAEVVVSVMLLIGSGLLIRSLILLEHIQPGFDATSILTTRIALPGSKYGDGTGAKVTAFWREAMSRIETIPGVQSVAVTSELPLSGLNNPTPRMVYTPGGKNHLLYLRSVSARYWDVMRIPLRAGRVFTQEDRKSTPRVVVINEQFRKDVFRDEDPIGKRVIFDFQERQETENYQAIVIGVVGDVRHTSLASPPFREAYLPLDQSPLFNYDLVVRTAIPPASISDSLKKAIWSMDPDESVGALRTVDEVLDLGLTQPRFRSYVLGGFAAMALVLSATGLYGLLNLFVSQRKREIGVRMALGASPIDVLRLVLGKGLALTAAGIGIGLLASLALTGLMRTLVYGVDFGDPITFVGGTAVLLIVAVLAGYLPSRRALNLDPASVLRSE